MHLPSWDIFIGLAFLFGIGYGFIIQRERTIATLCSVYVGIVIANTFSQTLYDFFNGNKVIADQIWVRSNASTSTISIVLLLASIIIVAGALNSREKKSSEVSMLEILIYSAFIIALVISSIVGFLPDSVRNQAISNSMAVKYLYNFRLIFVIAPMASLVLFGWKKSK